MNLQIQKVLAAKVAKAGLDRVVLNPARYDEIKEAITRADIRALIKSDAIKILPIRRPSKHRARARAAQRKKGRQRGQGTRKGAKYAREPHKRVWINKIRMLRRTLKNLKIQGKLEASTYKDLYAKSKGGFFRDRGHMMFYIESNKLLKQ
jgi:large subunit ribosomal protein L19e